MLTINNNAQLLDFNKCRFVFITHVIIYVTEYRSSNLSLTTVSLCIYVYNPALPLVGCRGLPVTCIEK